MDSRSLHDDEAQPAAGLLAVVVEVLVRGQVVPCEVGKMSAADDPVFQGYWANFERA